MRLKRLAVLCWLVCGLLAGSQVRAAEVYTYVDEQGNRVFTDQPRKNARRVDIVPSNTLTGTPPTRSVKVSPVAPPKGKPAVRYTLLRILVPEPDATVRNAEGNLIVTVSSDPALQEGHLYRLLLDGQPVAAPGRSPVLPLTHVDRGTHQLSVEIVDRNGQLLEKTPSQPFHLQRISLVQKRQANPCQLPEYGVRPECPLKDKPQQKNRWLPFF